MLNGDPKWLATQHAFTHSYGLLKCIIGMLRIILIRFCRESPMMRSLVNVASRGAIMLAWFTVFSSLHFEVVIVEHNIEN